MTGRPSGFCGNLFYGIGMEADPELAYACFGMEDQAYRDPIHGASPLSMRAFLLSSGCGVRQDLEKAKELLDRAAAQDPAQASTAVFDVVTTVVDQGIVNETCEGPYQYLWNYGKGGVDTNLLARAEVEQNSIRAAQFKLDWELLLGEAEHCPSTGERRAVLDAWETFYDRCFELGRILRWFGPGVLDQANRDEVVLHAIEGAFDMAGQLPRSSESSETEFAKLRARTLELMRREDAEDDDPGARVQGPSPNKRMAQFAEQWAGNEAAAIALEKALRTACGCRSGVCHGLRLQDLPLYIVDGLVSRVFSD